ncbi:MAG: helix-turn-helix domain-containing protein, partial [Actinomycetota bacterium]
MDRLDRAGVTAREREVLALLGERLTNGEIGERLYISVRTVESHVSSLLRKLGADTRRDLVQFASMAALRGFPVPSTSLIGREGLLDDIV